MEPITGKNGDMIKELTVPKGTQVIIAIRALNRDKSLWGEDADEWKPERWFFPVPGQVKEARIPGIFSHLMTFIGGPRSCLGFRFAELEIKIVLATLLCRFKFSLADEGRIYWTNHGFRYPMDRDGSTTEPALPLRVEAIP